MEIIALFFVFFVAADVTAPAVIAAQDQPIVEVDYVNPMAGQ